ncbi:alpha/beta hydrolase [Marinobacterium sp. CAU 1594]|nr:alpha/beta hydrolase [Marinobacterium arenosum]
MESITVADGSAIRYISLGQGRPLIFLHGWTANAREWLPFASELADRFQVFCWEARGHGSQSENAAVDADIERMADDLQQLIEHHDLHEVTLIGHSMGALTAWEYMRRFGSARLAGLCVVDQSPKLVTDGSWRKGIYGDFDYHRNQSFLARLQEDFAEGVLELVALGNNPRSRENYERNSRGFQQMRDYLRSLSPAPLIQCWDSLTQRDYRELLAEIDIPALLIYGDQSQFYSTELARWVAEQIPQSELHIYEESDHSPHLWHRERFIWDLRRFADAL